jgi:hypothetical protein
VANGAGHLAPLVGEWVMEISHPSYPAHPIPGRATFEWLGGDHFLVQRWNVDHPDFPDGIAVIGIDPSTGACLQHYFDSRGVARIYGMDLENGVWTLWRDASAPDFSQRFTGTFNDAGDVITAFWEIAHDHATYERDFDLTFRKVI